jgi:hypothetical protein
VSTDNTDSPASADHTAAADTSVGDPAPETVIVPDVSQPQVPDLAWSSDADTADYGASTERYTWSATWVRAAAFAAGSAVVAGAIGGIWWHQSAHTHAAPVAAPVVHGQVLDGVYEIASDNEHRTVNAVPRPGVDITRYWAFRSLCTQTGCVATAAEVDDISHQTPYADHDHSTWRWHDGSWQEELDHNTIPCGSASDAPAATQTMMRTLAPQPDGTLKGTETDAVDNDSPCGAGAVMNFSITAKRIGDTPTGVVADPADAGPPPPPTLYVTVAISPGNATTYLPYYRTRTASLADGETAVLSGCQRDHPNCVVAGYSTGCIFAEFDGSNHLWVGHGQTADAAIQDVTNRSGSSRAGLYAYCAWDKMPTGT